MMLSLTLSFANGLHSVRKTLKILGLLTIWILNLHFGFQFAYTKSYLLIQIGKAPVRKLQRHFSSSRPRCLSKIKMIYILRNILNLLQMLESKTRNISHHSHSCYLSFFFHGYQLKQCEGSCEQLLT